ncbi:MAG: PD40 domain-containing protein, partial [Deltaproteobacteria bacterium]|nr:PD40 domain-containing protein [Deltaproteobacteria bacterium]
MATQRSPSSPPSLSTPLSSPMSAHPNAGIRRPGRLPRGPRREGMVFAIFVALAALVWACADTTTVIDPDAGAPDTRPQDLTQLESLRIEPADAILHVENGKAVTQIYHAIGTFKGGATADITEQVSFRVRDNWVGFFMNNVFISSKTGGGKTDILADTSVGVSAMTGITVVYQKILIEGDFPPAKVKAFDSAKEDVARSPQLAYPPNGTLLPPNLAALEFQWRAGSGNDLFELRVGNGGTDIRIYTTCTAKIGSDGCGYTPSPTAWKTILTAFRGKNAATISVRASDKAVTQNAGTSAERTFSIASEDILGGLYYWNANPGTIIRYDFGKPKPKGTLYYTAQQAGAVFCVGCHALSRNGKRMAVALDIPAPGPLKILDVENRKILAAGAANFMAFSPDGDRILTSDGRTIVLSDTDTLKPHTPNPLVGNGTMPDWSPDGTTIVYAEPKSSIPLPIGAPGIDTGSLRLLRYSTDKKLWLGPKSLVDSQGGQNNYYPTFSPDNRLIVFNRSTQNSYDAPDASLWMIPVDDKGGPVLLKSANNPNNVTGSYGKSWPKFAPFVQTYKGRKLMWLTFSSRR